MVIFRVPTSGKIRIMIVHMVFAYVYKIKRKFIKKINQELSGSADCPPKTKHLENSQGVQISSWLLITIMMNVRLIRSLFIVYWYYFSRAEMGIKAGSCCKLRFSHAHHVLNGGYFVRKRTKWLPTITNMKELWNQVKSTITKAVYANLGVTN